MFAPLPEGPFDVVMADPPWAYRPVPRTEKTGGYANHEYQTIQTTDLMKLPLGPILARDAVLALWTTFPFQHEAYQVMNAWGFCPLTGAVWVKTTATGDVACGVGTWLRGAAEPILIGIHGSPSAPSKKGSPRKGAVLAPRGRHSEKPSAMVDLVEAMTNHLNDGAPRRLELFARAHRPGWTCWGDQLPLVEEDFLR